MSVTVSKSKDKNSIICRFTGFQASANNLLEIYG